MSFRTRRPILAKRQVLFHLLPLKFLLLKSTDILFHSIKVCVEACDVVSS